MAGWGTALQAIGGQYGRQLSRKTHRGRIYSERSEEKRPLRSATRRPGDAHRAAGQKKFCDAGNNPRGREVIGERTALPAPLEVVIPGAGTASLRSVEQPGQLGTNGKINNHERHDPTAQDLLHRPEAGRRWTIPSARPLASARARQGLRGGGFRASAARDGGARRAPRGGSGLRAAQEMIGRPARAAPHHRPGGHRK